MTLKEAIATLPADATTALTLFRPLNTVDAGTRSSTCPVAVELSKLTGHTIRVWPTTDGTMAMVTGGLAEGAWERAFLPTLYDNIVSILDHEAAVAWWILQGKPKQAQSYLTALVNMYALLPTSI